MKKEDRVKKVIEKMQLKKYAFGTGMDMGSSGSGMYMKALTSLMSFDVNAGMNGFNSLSSNHNQANPVFSMPEGGQVFAFGGETGGPDGPGNKANPNQPITMTMGNQLPGNDDPYWKMHPLITEHSDGTMNPWGGTWKPPLEPLTVQQVLHPQYPLSDKALGNSSTYYPANAQPVNPTPAAMRSTSGMYGMGTGQDGIHIKPSHKGRFTAWAKKHNMSISEAASHVMANKGKYPNNVIKMANFAKNFAAMGTDNMGLQDPSQPQQQQPVEVEGNEVAQTPNGQMMQFQGPSHEDGGIQANLPTGTKIFSDRLSIDGKTMQERKISRERQMKRLDSMLETNPADAINRNTYNRTKQAVDAEEQGDLMMQQAANTAYSAGIIPPTGKAIQDYQQRVTGQPNDQPDDADDQLQHFAYGGDVGDGDITSYNDYTQLLGLPGRTLLDPSQISGTRLNDTSVGLSDGSIPRTLLDPSLLRSAPISANYTPDDSSIMDQVAGKPIVNPNAGLTRSRGYTAGDNVGFMGNGLNSALPLITTLADRAGDKPNINPYKNFGFNALDSNQNAMNFVSTMRDKNLKDLSTQIAGQRIRNRNSATSIGTSRALDAITSAQQENSEDNIYSQYAQQMAGEYNERSKLNNQQDLYQGQGTMMQDRGDRVDRDAFYSNLGKNFANIGTNTQLTGKEMNQHQNNEDILSIMPYLSKYGLGFMYDQNGTPVMTKVQ